MMIDFRSDTVTQPTLEMREAMKTAPLGDDVYGEDPTVNRLEALAAQRMGTEAAVFMMSGTMSNQVAIMTHAQRRTELIADRSAHVIQWEGAAAAGLSGVGYALSMRPDHFVTAEEVRRLVRDSDHHAPRTSLVCLENALGNGTVVPLAVMQETYAACRELGIPVHLDGARIFNAAIALGVEASEIAACADSVSFCISKGLCSPIGALLCGTAPFIAESRFNRKAVGGGVRQAGVLAACGILSLETMVDRLAEDHENARYLAERLNAIPGITVDLDQVQINMVFWAHSIPGFSWEEMNGFMRARGVIPGGVDGARYRSVTHYGIGRAEIDRMMEVLKEYIAAL